MPGSNDDEGGLFDGLDDSTRSDGGEIIDSDQPPLAGSDAIDLGAWAKDLTYREVYAFTFGFVPWFLAVVTGDALLTGAAVGVVLAATYGRTTRRFATLPKYVVREPHYALGAAGIAWVLGSFVLGLASLLSPLIGVLG